MARRPKDLYTGSMYDELSQSIWEKFEQNQMTIDNFCHKMSFWKYLTHYIMVSIWKFLIKFFIECKITLNFFF